ncbi:MAG: DUF6263 family protein [Coleofasciculaceae cyanobacterium]
MKKRFFVGSICVLLVGGGLKLAPAAISKPSSFSLAQLTNSSQQTVPTAQPQLELLDPGTEAKQELRFQPAVNAKQTAIMVMDMDLTISIAGNSTPKVNLPATEMTMETVVTKVDDNGDIHYQFSYTDVDLVGDESVRPEVREVMREQIRKVIGLSGSVVIDNRGQTKTVNIVVPENIDESTKQMVEQISDSLKQISSPVPSQAVGVGAKWRVSSALNLRGISLSQIATYKLVSLNDDVATLEISIEQEAPQQNISLPGIPNGINLTLQSLDAQGQGQLKMSLNQLMPVSYDFSLLSNTEMSAQRPNIDEPINLEQQLQHFPLLKGTVTAIGKPIS